MEITSLDMSILIEELENLEGGHVQKVYQRGEELTIEIYIGGEGKKRLIAGTNYLFTTKYKRDNPTRPPGFCMELRKHLGRIDSIKQKGFDRILEIKSGDKKLILELFGKGNFILTKEGKIIGALRQEEWADRKILTGEEYVYPEPADDPRQMDDYIKNLSEGEVVRKIASDLSLGGTYAEEICARTDVDKNKQVEDLSNQEKQRLNTEIRTILEEERFPVGYYDGEDPERPAPFKLETYSDYREKEFESFSEALDEHFYTKEKRREEKKKEKKFQEEKQGLERQKQQMQQKIDGLKKSSEQKREDAEAIYENYTTLEKIKQNLEKGVKKHGWDKTREKIQQKQEEDDTPEEVQRINSLNEQEGFVSVDVGDRNLKIYLFQDLEATASEFYDKAKQSEQKIESAEEALKDVEEKLDDLEKEDIEIQPMEDKTQKRNKKWFEKYRWFRSSEDHLVIIGRDAQTNEMAVKKHMEKNDLYFHADFDGAPAVVVKDGQEAGEKTREEAAKAAVTFTKTWKAGIGSDDVYYVNPDQVTQEPEPGEYLEKGAFVIRGDREYIRNVSVEAAIGAYKIEGEEVPFCGPESAVKHHCDNFISLKPGRTKKSELAKEIQSKLQENGRELDLDYIIRALPPGKSDIK
ncbi:MAG: ribosome rescue protein RqcH [Candidatus Nanohaloarchaea archaeon]